MAENPFMDAFQRKIKLLLMVHKVLHGLALLCL